MFLFSDTIICGWLTTQTTTQKQKQIMLIATQQQEEQLMKEMHVQATTETIKYKNCIGN